MTVVVHGSNPSTWEVEAKEFQTRRDGSLVKDTGCSYRGPEFDS